MNQILQIHCDQRSPRLYYVLDFIFHGVLNTPYELSVGPSNHIHINYSEHPHSGIQIIPYSLLFEENISEQPLQRKEWVQLPIFFSTIGPIPFDIFSAIFYLISRYEEYLPHTKDEFQRFSHKSSLAFREGFLHQPLVDQWIELLRQKLNETFQLNISKPAFRYIPTYDIDIAYSYLGKGFWRNTVGALKDILHGKFSEVKNRLDVLNGRRNDPYNAYSFLDDIHDQYQLQPIYFFLMSDGGLLNKNLPPENPFQQALLRSTTNRYKTGIHPSYNSQSDEAILKKEILRVNGTENSRQHYIQFTLPETFRLLERLGIRHEYSMGYGSINGFRASTSNSFFWFDLLENKKTDLRIHPFCYMECNSRFEQKQDSAESLRELLQYKMVIQACGGEMISIFHNFSLSSAPEWKGWKEQYLTFLGSL